MNGKSMNSNDCQHGDTLVVPSTQQQVEYWQFWQRTRSCNAWARRRADFLLDTIAHLHLHSPSILDFGCGNGWFCNELTQFGRVTGVDLNEEAMIDANRKWPNIVFVGGDAISYDSKGALFDLVVSQQVIAHVTDQSAYVRKAASLLRHGGYFLLTTNNEFVMRRLGTCDGGSHRESGHIEHWLSTSSLRRLISQHFRIVRLNTLIPHGDGGILRVVNSPKVNRLVEMLIGAQRAERVKERMGLGYYLILLAKKL